MVRQRGPAGEFYNVTWPGAVGVLTAMAPGRFAASINKGPSTDGWGGMGLPNFAALGGGLPPPMHVLRQVFETAADFDTARRELEKAPIAAETIFTLVGPAAGQTCVIERKHRDFVTHLGPSTAANTWNYGATAKNWGANEDEDTRQDSTERRASIASFAGASTAPFGWVKPPLRYDITRLAVEANPAIGLLRVRGYEASQDREDAVPVTADFEWQG
ncbi:hypothetical protein AB4037_29690 [Labrys sp. KB_33_2]|uniref:hypothetical protein n=1 Tax=Labrys sp. KB_33_2 TaxID=3237479 RepID=UPI003F919652